MGVNEFEAVADRVLSSFWSGDYSSKPLSSLLLMASLLDEEEYESVVLRVREGGGDESVAFYLAYFNNLVREWVTWEEECRSGRGSKRCKQESMGVGGVAYQYSRSIKQLLLRAVEDHGLEWLVPYWLRWYAIRARSGNVLMRLSELSLGEQVRRLTEYPVVVTGLESISLVYLEHYKTVRGEGFGYTTASYIYWDLVKPFTEILNQRFSVVESLYSRPLHSFAKVVTERVRRSWSTGERLGLGNVVSETLSILRGRILCLLATLRSILQEEASVAEKIREKLTGGFWARRT